VGGSEGKGGREGRERERERERERGGGRKKKRECKGEEDKITLFGLTSKILRSGFYTEPFGLLNHIETS
jgi:hypothetical protein